jgi:hypothetical protein
MACEGLVLRAGIISKKIDYFLSSENKAGKILDISPLARKCADPLKCYQKACSEFLWQGKVFAHVLAKNASELHSGPLNLKFGGCF